MKIPVFFFLAAGALPMSSLGQTQAGSAALVAPNATPDAQKAQREAEARAEQERIHSRWNICVDVQMVALEETRALELIPEFQSGDQKVVDAAWTKLQEMIKTREAKLLAWPMVRMVNGDRVETQSVLEKRYPTEFEPPQTQLTGDEKPAATRDAAGKPTLVNAMSTGFETRSIGVMLEAEATVLDDGKWIHVSVVPQRVTLVEMESNDTALPEKNMVVRIPQPLFSTAKTTQALTLRNGERQLLGVHKLTKPADQVELHFIRAVVTKTE